MSLHEFLSRLIYGQPIVVDGLEDHSQYTPIPQPPTIPFFGNTTVLDKTTPIKSFELLWKQYGEIYRLDFPGRTLNVINSQRLAAEICDEKRFHKVVAGGLRELRTLVGDALFTAEHGEPNWAIAHRILTPAFSPVNIKDMFDDMFDICSQLVLKWERYGPEHALNPAEEFTRLAFDTVSLCTMGYRVNSFYNDSIHPFITSMGNYLLEAQHRARMPELVKSFASTAQWEEDRKRMNEIVTKVIDDRVKSGHKRGDLLDLMLSGKDSQTGQGLDEENVRYQLLTFLIAGHETTSGMLSFIMYELLKHPHAYAKVQEEVDRILGNEPIRLEQVSKLPYIVAVMREGLRLYPPAVMFGVTSEQDNVLDGEYFVPKGTIMLAMGANIHRDPLVWGEDADEFKPERMMDGKFEALPPKAWIPFGNGARACIGRAFAWQEAIIAIATLFQRFDFVMANSEYNLKLKQTLTIKPDDFYIRAIPRENVPPLTAAPGSNKSKAKKSEVTTTNVRPEDVAGRQKLQVLYGSNTGSSEAFAQRIVSAAGSKGFNASIATLDAATGHLPVNQPIVIITASFEGQPADNAGKFVEQLSGLSGTELEGVSYAVFGCGNRDWALTYQRIPRLVDETMEARGAKRIVERGEGDASGAEFFDSFDAWEEKLWAVLSEMYDVQPSEETPSVGLDVKIADPGTQRAISLRQPDAALGRIVENKLLTKGAIQDKRHIEFELPAGMTYSAGDYLAILPTNPKASVKRVLKHFKLSDETVITITADGSLSTLPTGRPVELRQVLSGYVELSQPATKRNLDILIDAATDETTKETLKNMASTYKESILDPRISALDLLCTYPSLPISLSTFLNMVPAMRVRQYSISSSPLWNPSHVTLTVSILNAPAASGSGEQFMGVGSTFLGELQPGDLVQMVVRPSAAAFSLPADSSTPLVLFCAGTGIAPMRGFIQERAIQVQSGRKLGQDVGKILLFFGCRDPEKDYLYSMDPEWKKWVETGVVDVRPAYKRNAMLRISLDKSCGIRVLTKLGTNIVVAWK
ncbi:bifunctional P-450/NADPH-P450 reductase [Serendipita vermifera]|nr:bifunctional P-450/NADPH-P450 reductase [Serendipita vermifera]